MIQAQFRTRPGRPPSAEDAAADIRRFTALLQARRQAAPDNLLELAALAVDLQRASVLWRQLAPQGVWTDAFRADGARGGVPPPRTMSAHKDRQPWLTGRGSRTAQIEDVVTGSPS